MGNITTRKKMNITYNNLYQRIQYDKAFAILNERIHKIPIKYVILILLENKFGRNEILSVLQYIQKLYVVISDELRYNEIKDYLDGYNHIMDTLENIYVKQTRYMYELKT